jgi:hypothetical protein
VNPIDQVIPSPKVREIHGTNVAAPLAEVWPVVRHSTIDCGPIAKALVAFHQLRPPGSAVIDVDRLVSTPAKPGFRVMVERPEREFVVAAIGALEGGRVRFAHASTLEEYRSSATPGQIRLAWAGRVVPIDRENTRIEIELRGDATDEETASTLARWHRLLGFAELAVRKHVMRGLVQRFGVAQPISDRSAASPGESAPPSTTTSGPSGGS